jgi:hypothetical protein
MPRPADSSFSTFVVLLVLPFTILATITTAASQQAPAAEAGSHQALGGIWVINRDRGDAPGVANMPDAGGDSDGRQGRAGGGGRGGWGGQGRGGYGREGQGRSEDLGRRQAVGDYVRASMEASKQLTIVVHETSVSITDAEGQVIVLPTDDKKTSDRAQNGLVKVTRRNHWDGGILVSEIDVDGGPKILRKYSLSPGGTELQISTTTDGAGRPVSFTRVYERPAE